MTKPLPKPVPKEIIWAAGFICLIIITVIFWMFYSWTKSILLAAVDTVIVLIAIVVVLSYPVWLPKVKGFAEQEDDEEK